MSPVSPEHKAKGCPDSKSGLYELIQLHLILLKLPVCSAAKSKQKCAKVTVYQ